MKFESSSAWFFPLLASACTLTTAGAEDDDMSCDPEQRTGSYVIRYQTLSGSCGPIPNEIGRFEQGAIVAGDSAADCSYGEPSLSNGGCTSSISVTCVNGATTYLWYVDFVQLDEEGAELGGTALLQVEDADGDLACSGNYRVTATRSD